MLQVRQQETFQQRIPQEECGIFTKKGTCTSYKRVGEAIAGTVQGSRDCRTRYVQITVNLVPVLAKVDTGMEASIAPSTFLCLPCGDLLGPTPSLHTWLGIARFVAAAMLASGMVMWGIAILQAVCGVLSHRTCGQGCRRAPSSTEAPPSHLAHFRCSHQLCRDSAWKFYWRWSQGVPCTHDDKITKSEPAHNLVI